MTCRFCVPALLLLALTSTGSSQDTKRPHQLSAAQDGGLANRASTSVPLDSWIYPAFERLAAWGYLRTQMLGQKPWTRQQCTRLVEEAREEITAASVNEVLSLYRALETEFPSAGLPRLYARLDSIYLRPTGISGHPVTDGYNFARTIVNDNGRPFEPGMNGYAGLSGHGAAGPLGFALQAEYQYAPSAAGLPAGVREAVAQELQVPVMPATSVPKINRGRLLEGYVTLAMYGVQLSLGKQALSWGPNSAGSLVWSTNAEPVMMLRIASRTPFRLPSVLRWLGSVQADAFLGQLSGHQYILEPDGSLIGPQLFQPQPYVHGQKLTLRPTRDLEIGFSRTVTFSGRGRPLTSGNFWNSFSSIGSDYTEPHADAGDRRSSFDVSYRVPLLRRWLTVYTDSFCEDDVLPLAAPNRCAWAPGFYVSHFPRLPRLDFRAEGAFTDVGGFHHSGTYYHNVVYPSGYTNQGNILGSWVGRQGRGVQVSSTYWFSPKAKLQATYRLQVVNRKFLRGGRLADLSIRGDFPLKSRIMFSGVVQREGWNFPLLAPTPKTNWVVSLGIEYRPDWTLR